MKQITEKIYTYDDLIENKIPEDVFEVIEGIGVEGMATSSYHNAWVSELFYYLRRYYGGNYRVLTNETSILISKNPLTYLNADIVLIKRERLPILTKNILEIPPDIVFEIVVSYEPNVEYKMKAYREIGVLKQFWIYPESKKVIVIDKEGNKVEYPFNKKIEIIEGKKILLSRFKI
jgi:Uma2 family endonuclease